MVKNKLPGGIDFSKFSMLNASHSYSLALKADTLIWTFSNIRLVDKNTNELLSHGLIRYKLIQQLNNPEGTELKNSAGIYFDFNAPVLTNEVLNTVHYGLLTGIENANYNYSLTVFPNPGDGHVTFLGQESGFLRISDSMGNIVFSENHNGSAYIDISHLSKGLYYYNFNQGVTFSNGKLVVK